MTKNKKVLSGSVFVIGVVALVTAFAGAGSGKAGNWPFTTLTPGVLATQGVTLTPATAPASLPVQASTAAQDAVQAYSGNGRTALETYYMHCTDVNAVPQLDEDCWVTSVSTNGLRLDGGPGSPSAPVKYLAVEIDPATGQLLEAQMGS